MNLQHRGETVRFECLLPVLVLTLAAGLAAGPARAAGFAWSAETPGDGSLFAPALGPNGDVYTHNGGKVSAYDATGQLLWSVDTAGALGPVTVGNDGTIYANAGAVGANPTIVALNPDGTEKWTFHAGANIHAGPNVGPDGNIYAVADTWFGGMGFFALDAGGNLLWSDEGEPELSADTGQPHEIVFTGDRAFVAMATQGAGGGGGQPAALWAFDLDAQSQAFVLAGSCQGQPVVSPLTGRLVTGNGICQAVETYDAASGDLLWSVDAPSQSPCSGMANIAVGPDGSVYTAFCYRAFWSLAPDGTERWFDDDFGFYFQMDRFGVTPDNTLVLDLGGDVGAPGWVRAFDTQTGALAWQLDLAVAGQKASSRPVFDRTTGRAYFNVNRFGAGTSDVYAVDWTSASPGPGGEVPDGDDVPAGTPLELQLLPGGDVRLSWGASCRSADSDYAVYEGRLGHPSSLVPVACSTAGARQRDVSPGHQGAFYLVVPVTSTSEGSYGDTSDGAERPPSSQACRPQILGEPVCSE